MFAYVGCENKGNADGCEFLSQIMFGSHTTGLRQTVSGYGALLTDGCCSDAIVKIGDSRKVLSVRAWGGLWCPLLRLLFGTWRCLVIDFPPWSVCIGDVACQVVSLALNSVAEFTVFMGHLRGTGIIVPVAVMAVDHWGIEDYGGLRSGWHFPMSFWVCPQRWPLGTRCQQCQPFVARKLLLRLVD